MSPLETVLQEHEELTRKGYSTDQIQCAALMLIGKYLDIVAEELIKVCTPKMMVNPAEDLNADD